MGLGTMGSTEPRMVRHFDHLLRDCSSPFGIEWRSIEEWKPFGIRVDDPDFVNAVTVVFCVSLILLFVSFGLSTSVPAIVFLFISLGFGYVLSTFEGERRETGFLTGPGFIKRYHVSMTDSVERVHQGLSFSKVPFKVYDVTLKEWPDRPRASIFRTDRSDLLVTVFKDKTDPQFTIVHIGGYSKKKRRAVTTLKRLLDGHVPDP